MRLPEFNGAASLKASCEASSSSETTYVVTTTGGRVPGESDFASLTLASFWLAPVSGGGQSFDTEVC